VIAAAPHSPWLRAHAAVVYAFLYLPVAVLVLFSFSASRYAAVWGGFSLEWYAKLFQNERLLEVLGNSLAVAAVAMLLAGALGTAAAVALERARLPAREAIESFMYLPVVMPELVQGIGLLMLFVLILPLPLGLGTIAIAHTVFGIAYVTIVVRARLHGLDPQLEEAARDLGATPWQVFRRVTLPLIWPGVLGGSLLAFTMSFDDFVIAFFVTGPGAATLPIEIYSMVKRGVTPEINALAALILFVSVILIAVSLRLQQPLPGMGEKQ
jgi:spermidine/putrescine transport system permease protein